MENTSILLDGSMDYKLGNFTKHYFNNIYSHEGTNLCQNYLQLYDQSDSWSQLFLLIYFKPAIITSSITNEQYHPLPMDKITCQFYLNLLRSLHLYTNTFSLHHFFITKFISFDFSLFTAPCSPFAVRISHFETI